MECDERHGQTVETYSADRISLLRDRSSYLAHRRKLLDVGTAERVAVVHSLRMGLRVINRDRAEVSSPLSPSDLRGIEATVRTVQFSTPLSDNDHQRLGAWFLDKSNVGLRAYGSASASVDYLRHYPRLHSFDIDCGHPLADIAGLKLLPANLRGLGLDVRLPKGSDLSSLTRLEKLDRLSLSTHRRLPAVVSALTTLRTLHLVGPIDDIAVVADLRSLESLTLRPTKVDLEPVSTLPGLRKLALKLGGGVDLGALSPLSSLEYLELWLIRGLADMSFLGNLTGLRELFLQALRNVVRLPDLSRNTALSTVRLETMKGLTDLSSLLTAPNLSSLSLVDSGHLSLDDLRPLKALPSVVDVHIGLGSTRKKKAARELLQLPGSYGHLDFPIPAEGDRPLTITLN